MRLDILKCMKVHQSNSAETPLSRSRLPSRGRIAKRFVVERSFAPTVGLEPNREGAELVRAELMGTPRALLEHLRHTGSWHWLFGGDGVEARVEAHLDALRFVRGEASARLGGCEAAWDLSQWGRRELTIRMRPGLGILCTLRVEDGQGRGLLELRREGEEGHREGMELLRNFLFLSPPPVPKTLTEEVGWDRRRPLEPAVWREQWDHRVRSGRDLEDLLQSNGMDRETGYAVAGPTRAVRLVAGRMEELLLRMSSRGVETRLEVGGAGARLACWKRLDDLQLTAGQLLLPAPGPRVTIRPRALERLWVVRHQCSAGSTLFLEAHEAAGRALLKLGGEPCPRLSDNRLWKDFLEECFPEPTELGSCVTARELHLPGKE